MDFKLLKTIKPIFPKLVDQFLFSNLDWTRENTYQ